MFCSVVSAVEEVAAVDWHGVSDGELCDAVVEMEQLAAIVDAQRARLIGAWDARKAWRASGAKTGAAWLTATCRIPHQEARRQLRLARAVRELPIAGAAWEAGEITAFHLLRLMRATNPRTVWAMARCEEALVDVARTETYAEFDRQVATWCDIVDPDGCDASAEERRTRRGMHLSESIDGMWFGNLVLDPVTGAIVSNELQRLETILFEHDRADAKQRLGIENPTVADLARTPQQRRADALALMGHSALESGRIGAYAGEAVYDPIKADLRKRLPPRR